MPELLTRAASKPRLQLGKPETLGHLMRLAGIGLAYFMLAKFGLQLASINPSATPIWPPTGFALAALLLWGIRIWPAVLLGAFVANATTSGTLLTASAIATGNTLEALIGAALVNRWAGGLRTFDTPLNISKFALVSFGASTPVSASVGVVSLTLAGFADPADFAAIWLTWWLGDLTGALLVTPVIVLWVAREWYQDSRAALHAAGVLALAAAVGIVAFSPLFPQASLRDPLGFLAVVPLLWAALTLGTRETASVALILSCFAVWGTLTDGGPFGSSDLNKSFLLLLMFMISTSLPSLVLSAEVAMRRAAQADLVDKEQSLRAIFSQALVGISQCDSEGRIEFANLRFWDLVGCAPVDARGKILSELIDDRDAAKVREVLARILAGEGSSPVEYRFIKPDGSRIWVRSTVSGLVPGDHKARRLLLVTEDITEQKDADERQTLLMAELNHRVRNTLAAVKAMVGLTARTAATTEELATALNGRIAAMARTHGLLTDRRWEGASLRELVSDELAPFQAQRKLHLAEGPDVLLRPKEAIDFALVLHELVTNAAKHGALSRGRGRVEVNWRIEDAENGTRLHFEWRETGMKGMPASEGRGFGLKLIERVFAASPGRSVKFQFEPSGISCCMTLLVDNEAGETAAVLEQSGRVEASGVDGIGI